MHLCGGVDIEAARWWCREIVIECVDLIMFGTRGTFDIAWYLSTNSHEHFTGILLSFVEVFLVELDLFPSSLDLHLPC